MMAKLRTFVVSVSGKLRAEFSFVLLVAVIIIAAITSFSYAYLRSDNQPTTVSTADETQLRQFEQFALSEPDLSTPAEAPTSNTPTESQTPETKPGTPATLGERIDCVAVNEQAYRKIESLRTLTLGIRELYKQVQDTHKIYEIEVKAKGCKPTIPLPTLDQLLQGLLR